MQPGDVLYIPALWLHNVTSLSFAVSVNLFFAELDAALYASKDLYANADPKPVHKATQLAQQAVSALAALPEHYQQFYRERLKQVIGDADIQQQQHSG